MRKTFDIRPAERADIPAIVDLLQKSLGASSTPKTEEYWRWKHLENPFGSSIVLLAEDGDEPVGVRAFMQWRWQRSDTVFRTLRAVDTATRPDDRRRGIFTTLTKRAVEMGREDGFDFIFNTPNKRSRPGYLKMGWEIWARMPLCLQLHRPFTGLSTFIFSSSPAPPEIAQPADSEGFKKALRRIVPDASGPDHECHLPLTVEYFRWRYAECPVIDYGFSATAESLLIYHLKETRFGRELRICDWLWTDDIEIPLLIEQLESLKTVYRPTYTSLPVFRCKTGQELLSRLWTIDGSRWSPVIAMRSLNRPVDDLPPVADWQLTTGSMELF